VLVTCEEHLLDTLRARRHALGLSGEAVDSIAGWQERYLAKVENPSAHWGRRAVQQSFWTWIAALDVGLMIVPLADLRSLPACASKLKSVPPAEPVCATPGNRGPMALSVTNAARAVGLSPRGLYRLIGRGLIATTKIGRRRLIPVGELEKLLAPTPARPRMSPSRRAPATVEKATDATVPEAP
jgi:excisionase family DNA binding protein